MVKGGQVTHGSLINKGGRNELATELSNRKNEQKTFVVTVEFSFNFLGTVGHVWSFKNAGV